MWLVSIGGVAGCSDWSAYSLYKALIISCRVMLFRYYLGIKFFLTRYQSAFCANLSRAGTNC
jgi:hypothetical protein